MHTLARCKSAVHAYASKHTYVGACSYKFWQKNNTLHINSLRSGCWTYTRFESLLLQFEIRDTIQHWTLQSCSILGRNAYHTKQKQAKTDSTHGSELLRCKRKHQCACGHRRDKYTRKLYLANRMASYCKFFTKVWLENSKNKHLENVALCDESNFHIGVRKQHTCYV